jgi:hypothetical protein
MMKIQCSRCGESSYTTLYERIGTRHEFRADLMQPCGGYFRLMPENEADERLIAVLKGLIK